MPREGTTGDTLTKKYIIKANFLLGSDFSMGFQEEDFVDAATEEEELKDNSNFIENEIQSEAKLSLLKSVYSLAEYGRKKRVEEGTWRRRYCCRRGEIWG